MSSAPPVRLERPRFGEFARHYCHLRSDSLEECLAEQARSGGRLGRILQARGYLTSTQLRLVLQLQARWVTQSMTQELLPHGLPYPTFLSLCLPAFNEKDNIEDTLDAACTILPLFVRRFEIVVIDDGSCDGTGALVKHYAENNGQVRLISHPENRGYGAAVSSGLRAAIGDLVAFTDSDGQFSMLDLPPLLAQIGRNDAVFGFRYRRADSPLRLFNAWGWNRLVRAVLGVQIRDLDCAFKLFRREVVEQLQLTAMGAAINAEILVQCSRRGWRFVEMPVNHYPRRGGAPTGAALRVIARAFRELPLLLRYRWRSTPVPPPVVPVPGLPEAASSLVHAVEVNQP
jgi:hypothetical protein